MYLPFVEICFNTLFYSMVINCVFFKYGTFKIGMDHICLFFSPVVMILTNNIDLLNKSKKRTNDRLGSFETEYGLRCQV